MFSKKKCPNCRAKNPKERMVCIECGTPLASEQANRQLSQVSTETEVPDKTVIEKEAEERIGDEYRDNEKVLYKTRGTLTLPGKEPEEADCFITERHLVIEAEEPIKVPVSRVQECDIPEVFPSVFSPTGTATLTFLDDLNKKRKLCLEIAAGDLRRFKEIVEEQLCQMWSPAGKLNIYCEAFLSLVVLAIFPVSLISLAFDLSHLKPKMRFNVLRDLFEKRTKTMGRVTSILTVVTPLGRGDEDTRYYITVEKLEFCVSERIYNWLRYNDEVVVDHWPHSKTVAKVERLSAGKTKRPS